MERKKKKKTKWENMPLLLLPHHLTLNSKSASAMCCLILVLEGPSPSLSVIERPTDVASVKRSSTESGPPSKVAISGSLRKATGEMLSGDTVKEQQIAGSLLRYPKDVLFNS